MDLKKITSLAYAAVCILFTALPLQAQDNDSATGAKKSKIEAAADAAAQKPAAEDSESVSKAAPAESMDEWGFDRGGNNRRYRGPVVVFSRNVELKTNESAEAVIVLWGNAIIRGKVRESVVTICGGADVEGEVRDAVVSI